MKTSKQDKGNGERGKKEETHLLIHIMSKLLTVMIDFYLQLHPITKFPQTHSKYIHVHVHI